MILKDCYLLFIQRKKERCFDEKLKKKHYQKRLIMVYAKYVRYLVKNVLFKCMEIHIFYHSSNGSNYFSSSIKLKYKTHLRVFVTKCCSFGTHKEPYCKWAIFSTTACCQDHTTTSTTSTTHTWCL